MTNIVLLSLELLVRNSLDRQRIFRDRTNVLDTYSDDDLRKRFRFGRNGIFKLVDLIGPDLQVKSRKCNFPPEFQILIALL